MRKDFSYSGQVQISALGRCKGYVIFAIFIGVNSRYQAPYAYEKQKQNIGNRWNLEYDLIILLNENR